MTEPRRLGRRAMLEGAGATALLAPWLGSAAWLATGTARAQSDADNLLLVSWPLGLDARWLPRGTGADYELVALGTHSNPLLAQPILQELVTRHRNRLLIVSGVKAAYDDASDADRVGPSALWTGWNGSATNASGASPLVSLDQIIAPRIKGDRPIASIHAGVMSSSARNAGADVLPFYHYAAPAVGIQPVDDPGRLFADLSNVTRNPSRELAAERSILRFAGRELERLEQRVAAPNRARLEAHLDRIRALEDGLLSGAQTCNAPATPDREFTGEGSVIASRAAGVTKAQVELLSLAFRCGLTKVATLQLAPAGGDFLVPYDGATSTVHEAAHNLGSGDNSNTRAVSARYFVDRLADILDVLESTDAGGGHTLLDRTLVVMSSEMGTPDGSPENVPVFIAGGSKNFFKRAQHVALRAEPRVSRLLVSLLRYHGVDVETAGNVDSGNYQGVIEEILV